MISTVVVEQIPGALDRLAEAPTQMVDALQKSCRGLIPRPRIVAGEEVGVVAVRGRVGHLGQIG